MGGCFRGRAREKVRWGAGVRASICMGCVLCRVCVKMCNHACVHVFVFIKGNDRLRMPAVPEMQLCIIGIGCISLKLKDALGPSNYRWAGWVTLGIMQESSRHGWQAAWEPEEAACSCRAPASGSCKPHTQLPPGLLMQSP